MSFHTLPFTPTAQRAEVVSEILREILRFETVFNDYERGCEAGCGDCEHCLKRKYAIAAVLSAPDARVWEVWSDAGALKGIIYFTDIMPGEDAIAHYCFFDGRLKDKTDLLKGMAEWAFTPHTDWKPLRRLTVTVPDYAFALARHATRQLGFTGDYSYTRQGVTIPVEGVKRGAMPWRGQRRDLLIMGLLNPEGV